MLVRVAPSTAALSDAVSHPPVALLFNLYSARIARNREAPVTAQNAVTTYTVVSVETSKHKTKSKIETRGKG